MSKKDWCLVCGPAKEKWMKKGVKPCTTTMIKKNLKIKNKSVLNLKNKFFEKNNLQTKSE
jgi:hypothetical protein